MNWKKTNQSLPDKINLRKEMHGILYGDATQPKKGHWIVYRRFNRCETSEYYSERTKEGVGGPANTYTDQLIRTRRVPVDKAGLPYTETPPGIDLSDKYLYYFEYKINPKVGDQIFELNLCNHNLKPVMSNLVYGDRLTIKRVHDYRLECGTIQYWVVSTQIDEVSY
jgi:hypothetical protein